MVSNCYITCAPLKSVIFVCRNIKDNHKEQQQILLYLDKNIYADIYFSPLHTVQYIYNSVPLKFRYRRPVVFEASRKELTAPGWGQIEPQPSSDANLTLCDRTYLVSEKTL